MMDQEVNKEGQAVLPVIDCTSVIEEVNNKTSEKHGDAMQTIAAQLSGQKEQMNKLTDILTGLSSIIQAQAMPLVQPSCGQSTFIVPPQQGQNSANVPPPQEGHTTTPNVPPSNEGQTVPYSETPPSTIASNDDRGPEFDKISLHASHMFFRWRRHTCQKSTWKG